MVDQGLYGELRKAFYRADAAELLEADADALATNDSAHDISSMSLSPLGIVHLFRQFCFALEPSWPL